MLVFSASGINHCVQTLGQTGMAAWSMECPHSSSTLATNPRSTSSAGWLHKYNVLKCHISINKSVLFLWNQKRWRQLSFFFLQDQNLHPLPQNLVRNRRCTRSQKTQPWYEPYSKTYRILCNCSLDWSPPNANFHNLFFMHSYQTAVILERSQSKNQIS